jgi:hypothetical protein
MNYVANDGAGCSTPAELAQLQPSLFSVKYEARAYFAGASRSIVAHPTQIGSAKIKRMATNGNSLYITDDLRPRSSGHCYGTDCVVGSW